MTSGVVQLQALYISSDHQPGRTNPRDIGSCMPLRPVWSRPDSPMDVLALPYLITMIECKAEYLSCRLQQFCKKLTQILFAEYWLHNQMKQPSILQNCEQVQSSHAPEQ